MRRHACEGKLKFLISRLFNNHWPWLSVVSIRVILVVYYAAILKAIAVLLCAISHMIFNSTITIASTASARYS
jgi:hypothetical protein